MDTNMERECSALGGLFQTIVNDMKASYPTWEDFVSKATKLQSHLKTMIIVTGSFLDAFQKIADMAINTRGATKEIGSALTRMCMRHRNIESRLKHLTVALTDNLINPLEGKMEEWKKVANQLDKDHAKEYKKARADIKKKSSDTIKLQKKVKKGKDDARLQLDSALQDVNDKYVVLEETEKKAVYKALVEERGRFCMFVSFLKPVLDEEIGMLGEITHLQTILEDLSSLTAEPSKLPPMSEQVIHDLKNSDYNFTYQTPPGSPSGTLSRKASTNSYMHGSMRHVPSMDSISSSMEALHVRPPSTLMLESMFQDPRLNSIQQPPTPTGLSGENGTMKPSHTVDGARSLGLHTMNKPKSHRDHLALALSQGLSSEMLLSRDSLHCSSGYSTQTTTPSCSDDTIPSHVSDYDYISLHGEQEEPEQLEFDKSSTIPRNSDISLNYRRMFQAKRPASTVSLLADSEHRSPYVATIKRKPSNKPTLRRGTVSGVPIPIRPPVVPLKATNYPEVPISPYGERSNSEEFAYFSDGRGDLSQMKPGLCTSAQSLNALQTPCCAFIPKQSYSYSQCINQQPPSPNRVFTIHSAVVDGNSVSHISAPSIVQNVQSQESSGSPAGSPQQEPQDDMLSMIRRGVKLRKTISNDRSAPLIK
ncbi:metastasis suppressor 1, gene 2 L homeolog isoform X1 [Xenopus laevis]|uniref:Metastasis suppressor 1, gene 2 L homeolog isoform X1 n=1 Tax=Xenopus laevis TaxID=8355 RepID=A0A8J0TJP6_XENLA|nr:metastasis suppressor 1, gene 2 L homeolog isoform X1 [Xenopus laevis]